jgi:succinate dehydrogenase / fumarate reductase flavoprotein subunit
MEDYAPKAMELAPRDIVARAIQREIEKGNGFENEYVHLDLRHLGKEKIMKRLPGIREICIYFAGLDPIDTPIPIHPAQHYSMGGIDVDKDCASPIAGLYAAGECACVSVHGANRLGGNSLLEAIVFGKIAGGAASRFVNAGGAGETSERAIGEESRKFYNKITAIRQRSTGENIFQILNRLKAVMSEKAGIFRKEKTLREGLREIPVLREAYERAFIFGTCSRFCQELLVHIEFEFMLDVAEAILLAALQREETRGSHYRTDFPVRDDTGWLKHTIMAWTEQGPRITHESVDVTKYKPEERKY